MLVGDGGSGSGGGGGGGGGGKNAIDTSVVFPSTETKVTKTQVTILPSKQVYVGYLTYLQLTV